MCNGANLAYKIFLGAEWFWAIIIKIAGGDVIFSSKTTSYQSGFLGNFLVLLF
jgi:hypothetical protein